MQFSLSRLLLLLRKQFAEHGRVYTLGLLALAGLWAILLVLIVYQNGVGLEAQHFLLGMGLIMGGVVFAQHLFQPLTNASEAIRYLHLPASSFEKVVAVAVSCLLVFFPVVVVTFYLVDYPIVMLARQHFAARPDVLSLLKVLPISQLKWHLAMFVLATAAMAFGSVYFRRYALVKTVLSVMVLAIGLQLLNQGILGWVMDAPGVKRMSGEMFENVILMYPDGPNDLIELPNSWKAAFEGLFLIGLPVFCWLMSWLRLRETEV